MKRELDILWHDYFKPEHLEKYPDLHDTFWKAAKLASKNKTEQDPANGEALIERHRGDPQHLLGDQGPRRRLLPRQPLSTASPLARPAPRQRPRA